MPCEPCGVETDTLPTPPRLYLTCPGLPPKSWLIRVSLLVPAPSAWSFSPWHGRSPVSYPACKVPFPPRRPGEARCTRGFRVRGSVWDPEPSRERVGDWGGPETVWALLCVAARLATRPNGEWGYSTRRHMLGREHPEAVSPARGVVLADLQSSIDCQ